MGHFAINQGAVFQRHEKKYALSTGQWERLTKAISSYTEKDAYGVYTVCSLYYDTDDYRIIRASRAKPAYKEKLRLRSYGTPTADSTVFLELKKKVAGVVYKRRISLPCRDALAYLDQGSVPILPEGKQTQIFREIDWFCHRVAPVPKVMLSCDRIALHGAEDPELRITLDTGIRWRNQDLHLESGDYGIPLLEQGRGLMEIKAVGPMPLWLTRILAEQQIFPTSFSKYGTVYEEAILKGKGEIRRAG